MLVWTHNYVNLCFCFLFFLSFTGNTVGKWQSNLCMMRKDIMDFQICCSNHAPAAPSLTPAEPKSSSIDVMAKTACVTCNWWKKCSRRTCRNSRREPQAGQQGSSSSLSQGFGAVAPFHSYVTFDPVLWSALLVILVNCGQLKVVTPFLKIWSKWDDFFFSVKCMWWDMFCVLVLWTFIQFHDCCGVSQVSLGQIKLFLLFL